MIGTTYGTGDGSTTFALPNLTDKFIQGSSTAGTVKAAGLPDIAGSMLEHNYLVTSSQNKVSTIYEPAGAFSVEAYSAGTYGPSVSTATAGSSKIYFKASDSNAIYGNASTVQPPALTMKYAIYTGVTSNHKWVRQS